MASSARVAEVRGRRSWVRWSGPLDRAPARGRRPRTREQNVVRGVACGRLRVVSGSLFRRWDVVCSACVAGAVANPELRFAEEASLRARRRRVARNAFGCRQSVVRSSSAMSVTRKLRAGAVTGQRIGQAARALERGPSSLTRAASSGSRSTSATGRSTPSTTIVLWIHRTPWL